MNTLKTVLCSGLTMRHHTPFYRLSESAQLLSLSYAMIFVLMGMRLLMISFPASAAGDNTEPTPDFSEIDAYIESEIQIAHRLVGLPIFAMTSLSALRLFIPDFGWVLTLSGGLALAWVVVRPILILNLGKHKRSIA